MNIPLVIFRSYVGEAEWFCHLWWQGDGVMDSEVQQVPSQMGLHPLPRLEA